MEVTVRYGDGGRLSTQAEWKLRALSATYRLNKPDRHFEELRSYSTELQTHVNSILKIRAVSGGGGGGGQV